MGNTFLPSMQLKSPDTKQACIVPYIVVIFMPVNQNGNGYESSRVLKVSTGYTAYYNAHNITGLGSALWMVGQYWNQPPIAVNALYQ